MDSTISVQPGEAPDSLHRARRAAWGSFAGAVVDWYDFLLYGITAALVFNREFFPQIGPAMGTLAAFATFGVGFLFRPLGGIIFWPLRRSPRAETDADDDRLDDGYRHCLHRPAPLVQPESAGGRRCCWCSCVRFRDSPSAANGAARRCSRWRMPRRGKKPFTAAGCRWVTASASCSLPVWYR
ncbi:Shikimate transporter [Klebsiella pneumoniae]|nr:Shikimate transporter [Klebsiella pneumoniae]